MAQLESRGRRAAPGRLRARLRCAFAPETDPAGDSRDAYYQFPQAATPSIDAGIGLHGTWGLLMPYVQAGQIGVDGSGWYTTQGVAIARGGIDYRGARQYTVGWMPSLAYQSRQDRSTIHFFASAFFVTTTGGPYNSFAQNGLALTAGLIATRHGRQDKR